MSNGPVVVIPAAIDVMDWSYDVERSILEPLGIQLIVAASPDEARAVMPDADVIFTSTPISADDIATLRDCAGIVCYSVGMDYVDAKAAAERGIPVWNCPTSNNEEVSDHAVLLILAAQRRLLPFAMAARDGKWDIYQWPELGEIHRLASRTVGIIGLGRIGHLVARKLHGFRLTVIAYDPYIAGTADPEVELVSLDELCARADIVVSCAALTDTSRGLIDATTIAKMRPGVIVVNVSRGGVVVEDALADALEFGPRRVRRARRAKSRTPRPGARSHHTPAERPPDAAHRGQLGRVRRRAARRSRQPDRHAASPGRPAPGSLTSTELA